MGSRSRRGKRRGPNKAAITTPPTTNGSPAAADRYQKFLPEWMRGADGRVVRPPRPARPKRYRQPRPAGGYTPGKMVGLSPDPLA